MKKKSSSQTYQIDIHGCCNLQMKEFQSKLNQTRQHNLLPIKWIPADKSRNNAKQKSFFKLFFPHTLHQRHGLSKKAAKAVDIQPLDLGETSSQIQNLLQDNATSKRKKASIISNKPIKNITSKSSQQQ